MLRLPIVFFVSALIAGLFGLVGAGGSSEGAKVIFFLFLVLAALSFLVGRLGKRAV